MRDVKPLSRSHRDLLNLRDNRGEGEWAVIVVLAIIALAIYGGRTLWQESSTFGGSTAPHSLKADNEFHISCKGSPSVKKEGTMFSSSETFEVSFVDESGLKHTLHGIHKVETSELPAMIDVRMPYPLPPLDGTDSSGQPYKEGNVYTWADGAKAKFRNRSWVAIQEPNTICSQK